MTEPIETEGGTAAVGRRHRRQAITVIGAPIEAGASVAGCAMGPAMLRTAGIVRTLAELGHDVVDLGDLAPGQPARHPRAPEGKARSFAEIAAWARDLARETHAILREGRLPLVLGGDHSLAMGSITGVARYAAEAGRSCSSCGSTPTRTTIRREPRRRATCTACRSRC